MFARPDSPDFSYIRRVVGLDGDALRVAEHRIQPGLIDSARCNAPRVITTDLHGREAEVDCWEEHIGDARWRIVVDSPLGPQAWFGPATVPPDSVFLLGDNRAHSADGRVWGPVPRDFLLGAADQIVFSWDRTTGPRWERVGTPLQP